MGKMELFLTVILYAVASLWQGCVLFKKRIQKALLPFTLGSFAIGLHAHLIYQWLGFPPQQNLSLVNLASLVTGFVAFLTLFFSLFKPIRNLIILIFPLAGLSLLAAFYLPSPALAGRVIIAKQGWHIVLATLAFGVMAVAALQAMLLGLQEHLLHRRHASGLVQVLPPLQTMDVLLFELISLGFILLSLLVAISWWIFAPITVPFLWQKLGISLVAWLTFAILLCGHFYFGWRGIKAVRWTLAGVGWIMLVYFGSEILLHWNFKA